MALAITVQKRAEGKIEAIREAGFIPAVVYGSEIESVSVQVDYRTFEKLYKEAGDSTLVEWTIEGGATAMVVVQDMQYHPIKDQFVHIDFMQVKMGEEMSASIELVFTGDSTAVKQGGTLVTQVEMLDVKCLPKDLVSSIEVDLTSLATFDDVIRISDLKIPASFTLALDSETVVATVSAPLTAEQIEAMEEAGPSSIEDIAVEEKGKKEAEEEAAA